MADGREAMVLRLPPGRKDGPVTLINRYRGESRRNSSPVSGREISFSFSPAECAMLQRTVKHVE